MEELFAGRHFDRDVIILCVRWYLRYKLSFRDLVEMMAERAVHVAHTKLNSPSVVSASKIKLRLRSGMPYSRLDLKHSRRLFADYRDNLHQNPVQPDSVGCLFFAISEMPTMDVSGERLSQKCKESSNISPRRDLAKHLHPLHCWRGKSCADSCEGTTSHLHALHPTIEYAPGDPNRRALLRRIVQSLLFLHEEFENNDILPTVSANIYRVPTTDRQFSILKLEE